MDMTSNSELPPFTAARWARGGHLQTIIGYYLPGPNTLPAAKTLHIPVSGGDVLLADENLPAAPGARKLVVLFHGLGGHSESPYMLRIATRFYDQGWRVIRVNHRGAGKGAGKARQLYHSGRSEDIDTVLRFAAEHAPDTPMVAIGFSLSGNMLLKYLGDGLATLPETLAGAISVSPPVDLALCARAISRRSNIIYDQRFVRMLRASLQERRQAFADFTHPMLPEKLSLREFDEYITAPLCGFADAADYYARCSANQFLEHISTPTTLIAADDDPFIPVETYTSLPKTRFLDIHITRSGGHVGFVNRTQTPLGDRRWLDYALLQRAQHYLAQVQEPEYQ